MWQISWSALGVPIGFERGRTENLRKTFSKLRPIIARICPGREHIVPSTEEFDGQALVSDYNEVRCIQRANNIANYTY